MSGPVFVQTPNFTPAAFTNSDAANTKKTIVTAGASGSKVVAISATSTETANDLLAEIWITRSATSYLLCSVTVLRNSGFNGTAAAIDLKNATAWPGLPTDNDGQTYLFLKSGDTLQVSFTTQVASGKEIDVFAVAADF